MKCHQNLNKKNKKSGTSPELKCHQNRKFTETVMSIKLKLNFIKTEIALHLNAKKN